MNVDDFLRQFRKHSVIVLLTKDEHDRLNRAGFGSKMPEGVTDFRDRCTAVDPPIRIVPNSR